MCKRLWVSIEQGETLLLPNLAGSLGTGKLQRHTKKISFLLLQVNRFQGDYQKFKIYCKVFMPTLEKTQMNNPTKQ